MNPGNDDQQNMRPEYDIRGGVRGKYFLQVTGSGKQMSLAQALWIQPSSTESTGIHPSESTIKIGVEPLYPRIPQELGEPAAS